MYYEMMIDGDDGYMKLFSFTIHEERRSGFFKDEVGESADDQ